MQFETIWEDESRCITGPCWLTEAGALLMLDPAGGVLLHHDMASGTVGELELGGHPSFIVPSRDGELLFGSGTDLKLITREGEITREEILDTPATRTLSATVDAHGRLWFGMTGDGEDSTRYGLYRYHDWRQVQMLFDCTRPGGVAIDTDAKTLFFADGTAREIAGFVLSSAGSLSLRKTVVSFGAEGLVPTGLALDEAGNLWVGFAENGELRCYSPTGECLHSVDSGLDGVTGLTFGGEGLRSLFVTGGRGSGGAVAMASGLETAGLAIQSVKLGHVEMGLVDDDEH